MAFELFERKSRPSVTTPIVGVQTRGTMSLNAAAFELLANTGKAQAFELSDKPPLKVKGKQTAKAKDGADAMVEFLYDKEERIVGIRLASAVSMNAYPVRRQPQAESYLVTAKAFLAYHGIATDKMRRYSARLYDGTLLGFSLKDDEIK